MIEIYIINGFEKLIYANRHNMGHMCAIHKHSKAQNEHLYDRNESVCKAFCIFANNVI